MLLAPVYLSFLPSKYLHFQRPYYPASCSFSIATCVSVICERTIELFECLKSWFQPDILTEKNLYGMVTAVEDEGFNFERKIKGGGKIIKKKGRTINILSNTPVPVQLSWTKQLLHRTAKKILCQSHKRLKRCNVRPYHEEPGRTENKRYARQNWMTRQMPVVRGASGYRSA